MILQILLNVILYDDTASTTSKMVLIKSYASKIVEQTCKRYEDKYTEIRESIIKIYMHTLTKHATPHSELGCILVRIILGTRQHGP